MQMIMRITMSSTRLLVGDFETTVFEGQSFTEVWASAVVELGTEDVGIFHSIDETFAYLKSLKSNVIIYYHNLKFDGAFWISYLLEKLSFKQAYIQPENNTEAYTWLSKKSMPPNSFKYSITDRGMWYTITIKLSKYFIEIRDSLKLLPFSVKQIGKSFGTKHKKSEMEYTGFRFAGCPITAEEKQYIANDVLVVKEALEIMFSEGHTKLTIGSCCLAEYKTIFGKKEYEETFPDIYEIKIDKTVFGEDNAGDYIRHSYKGGWCYLVRGKENKIFTNGLTADVNSLYPSVMHSESNSYYPIGKPEFWSGDYVPEFLLDQNNHFANGEQKYYYFIRIKTRFYLKHGKLPFIQIKGNVHYHGTEMLETSDVLNLRNNNYYPYYKDIHGEIHQAIVTLTLTMTDFKLLKEHYQLVDFEILDGCYFLCRKGIFDDYINKYRKIKVESTGAKRQLAKLFLNNLYGKMASNTDSSFKVVYLKEDKSIGFVQVEEHNKTPGYIPVGSAITSYARNFTIRTAQKNYHGLNGRGFIYADTDSIHCDLKPDELIDVPVHPTEFCHWKLESSWDEAYFTRQKTYIEHIVAEDLKPVEHPYYSIKCAGMPDKCKHLFELSLTDYTEEEYNEMPDNYKEFVSKKRTLDDFKRGLKVPGKLMPKRIQGGVLLVETDYEMR